MIEFPRDFTFGTATASHQIEGDNMYNDWWYWETTGRLRVKSGKACNHWELYREDIELMSRLGYDGYRFSIEWSRIFPQENLFDERALNRYVEIVELLRKHGITPVVTLHHFTSPKWFIDKGGWLREENISYFRRYVEAVVDSVKGVNYWVVFNEPNVYILQGYIMGAWPPGYKSLKIADKAAVNIVKAYKEAYEVLKGRGKVGVAQNLISFKPASDGRRDLNACEKAREVYNHGFLKGVLQGEYVSLRGIKRIEESDMDFIGVNYYSGFVVKHVFNPLKMFMDVRPLDTGLWTTMGYCIYPRGIYEVTREVYDRYRRDIIITENGVAVKDDELRILSIVRHLQYVYKALSEGIPIHGYYYWSFMDNYEWDKGFEQRFGLFEVDYSTFERKPRRSAYVYSEIARTKRISDELLEKYGEKQS
ncbi:glycoside hydrolase family 1 protein [Desulfurococcus amylolyticus]|uniref:glycoside hydrolase family 1 protein n=1 Tax=Desulfurococcus amylolyticus TaxID=94694 RepID=UPI000A068440|nr:glycoside hydrolase family 1 protein [Desulfurococcus amylolyticus]